MKRGGSGIRCAVRSFYLRVEHPTAEREAEIVALAGTRKLRRCAAISMADRFMLEGPGVQPIRVCLERNAQCFTGSIQLASRKKPLRHLLAMSEEFAAGNRSASSGRTLLAGSHALFVWASIADVYGLPGIPEWADWFEGELKTHHAVMPALGIGCDPLIVKAEKEQFLDWLSWGVESDAIRFPVETGSVRWPLLSRKDIFQQVN